MKLKLIVTLSCMSVIAVSCAHKPLENETTKITQENTLKPETKPVTESKPVVAETKKGDISLNCVLGQDTRVITLQKGDKRCEVHYTKSGSLNNIAWGEKTPTICDNVFDNVRGNIEKGGFKCSEDGLKTASVGK